MPHTGSDATKALLVKQVVAPVRWYQSIETLRTLGGEGMSWLEVGPGRTLTGMMRKIDRKAAVENYSTIQGLEK